MTGARNAGHALATVVVDELVRCGVRHVCLGPGSRSTPMALALDARPEVDLHVSVDERSAAFLALGLAKATRVPAAVLTTSGTAVTNLYPAVTEAFHAQVPMIVLTADRPPELRDTGAGQTIDQIKVFGDAVRWFVEVGVGEARADSVPYWRAVASRAAAVSRWPVPGPVHLNLAFRNPLIPVADETGFPFPLDGREGGVPWTVATESPMAPSEEDVARLVEAISGTERGAIAVGTGRHEAEPILETARRAGWPVLAEATSNVRTGPPAISTFEALLRDDDFARSHRPDLVIRVGHLGTSPSFAGLLDPVVRQISIDPSAWLDPSRSLSWILRADPGEVFGRLARLVPVRGETEWLRNWTGAENRARRAIDRLLDGCGVTEPRIARDLAACLPDGSLVYVASSMPIRDLDWFMQTRPGLEILANRGANGIDGFVSSVLGAAISHPGPVVALCGDLSLLHDQNGLLQASEPSISAVFVVVNNDGGGIFSFLPQAGQPGFERLFGTPHGLDFSRLAEVYSCGYQLVHDPSELAPAVLRAVELGGVHLVEARTDRDDNVGFHGLVWQSVAKALRGR
ncbi:MAG TPA: 2-succinyl-5-enolpyruvyl-6-hydroxy-3-cyclohexene-1-carboxylic-acid synthase [Actinomycetota bacterium]|nr:2-succinyl-5-enolpyruvyl-6-hydroxy-3-cyclohexene-1-carboxylic-acid synthase [Actinomycetota bacterium]